MLLFIRSSPSHRPDLVPLVLLGPRGVGKSAFVSSLIGKEYHSLVQDLTLPLFNREVCVRIFEGDKELGDTRPRTFIIFFNLTIKVSPSALQLRKRVSSVLDPLSTPHTIDSPPATTYHRRCIYHNLHVAEHTLLFRLNVLLTCM